jgi:hypothetical protein
MVTTTEEELILFFKDLTTEHGGNNSDYKDNISSVREDMLWMSGEDKIDTTKMLYYGLSIMVQTKDGSSDT